jgi:exodeoxyribonuclease VII small subunit
MPLPFLSAPSSTLVPPFRLIGLSSSPTEIRERTTEKYRIAQPLVSPLRPAVNCSCEKNVNTPAPNKSDPPKKPDFERSLARLEEVVGKLESPQLSLDDAMKLFEEGVALSAECQKQLEEAEGKVEILLRKADGKVVAEPFDPESEPEST